VMWPVAVGLKLVRLKRNLPAFSRPDVRRNTRRAASGGLLAHLPARRSPNLTCPNLTWNCGCP